MYAVRRTSMRHGLFTDAVTRFNKGQSPLQNHVVLAKMVQDFVEQTGAKAGKLEDIKEFGDKVFPSESTIHDPVVVSVDFINTRLGSSFSDDDVVKLLEFVEFDVDKVQDELEIQAPFWRTDIELPEDVVEEVGRLYGFDKLPVSLPLRSSKPAENNALLQTKSHIRDLLAAAGANEVLTYSFVHENLMQKVGQNKDNAYHVRNAISPDLQYYRMSLIPSLLDKVHPNIKSGHGEFALFEMNKVHNKDLVEDGLPIEENRLGLVIAADEKTAKDKVGAAYFTAKKYLKHLADNFGVELQFEPATTHEPQMEIGKAAIAPFESTRSAYVKTKDGELIAEIGEFKASVRKNLKLPAYCAGFELDVDRLMKHARKSAYIPLPRFPKVEQDISLRVPEDVAFADVQDTITLAITSNQPQGSRSEIDPLDAFQKAGDTHKQLAFRLSIANYDRTLTAEEVNALLDQAAVSASQFGAERI